MANTKKVRSNLEIANDLTVDNNVAVTGNASITGTLGVTGTTTVQDLVVSGVFNPTLSYLSQLSSVKLVSNTSPHNTTWFQMSSNSITLTPGVWELSGGIQCIGGAISLVQLGWFTANGDDTTAYPSAPAFSLTGGNTLEAASTPDFSGKYYSAVSSSGDLATDLAPFIRLNITVNQTIYLVPNITSGSGTDTSVKVSIYANKL